MAPKVGIFTRPIDQKTSGSGFHLKHLVNCILELNNKFNIVLIHYRKSQDEIYNKTDELIIPKNPISAHFKLRKENFDILHYAPVTILSPIWLKNPKKVATIHGGGAAQYYFPNHYSRWQVLHAKLIKPLYIRKLDFIFTGAKASKYFFSYYYRVNEEKIFFTYSAAESKFKVDKNKFNEIRTKFGIDMPFLFHISKFSERKNPWTILRAFKILKEKKINLKFVIAGKGWENKKVIDFIKQNNLLKDVIFTGFITQEEVIKLMNSALIFVFPSFFEGFGMPNLEAMACGCPVITSRGFAISEVVGNAALILSNPKDSMELADKIILLIKDKSLREEIIERGLMRVKLYSWTKSAQVILDTYEKCLKM